MTVFVSGHWLNILFISLWLSLTPTRHRALLIKCLLTEFFLFLSFPFSFLLSPLFSFCFTCFTLLFLLCLTAFIQHLKQFLSFHLMEAEGRQNDAIIKHALYNSRAVWAPCCDTASHWPNVSLPFLSYLSRDFCPSWAQNSGPISYFLIYRHIVFVHC